MFRQFLLLLFFGLLFGLNTIAQNPLSPGDSRPGNYEYQKTNRQYKHFSKKSFYLSMRDGVKLAVDVYIPKGLKKGQKIPAILYQTRYFRSIQLRGPLLGNVFKMIPSTPNFEMKEFIRNGYALICVDVRGTGSSFGKRTLSLPDSNEIKDGAEVCDWIIKQKWSDGKIGATGISYIGITAQFLMMNRHPAVKAVAPLFTPFDFYDDVGMPGGIFAEKFITGWNKVCERMDQGIIPRHLDFVKKMLVSGVGKADPWRGWILRKKAFNDHKDNFYQNHPGTVLEFMDDSCSLDGCIPRKAFKSPHLVYQELNQDQVPVYSYTGWWDLGFTKGGVRQFLNYSNPQNKLMLGPWSHGGVTNISHYSLGKTQFDHIGEVMKFFDYHLKGISTGIEKEPKVSYYTIGAEKWNSSNTWPPANSIPNKVSVGKDWQASAKVNDGFVLKADSSFGTGIYSRWNLGFSLPQAGFPDLKDWDQKTLYFLSNPLDQNTEVTGHPVISLKLKSNKTDGALFAYLLDVDTTGKVHYVSEGHLRLAHSKTYDKPVNYQDVVPYHSYYRKDAIQLSSDEYTQVVFDFFPVSYEFRKGHRMKLALATGDKDYFHAITEADTYYEISQDLELTLPILH
ncbi:MAG: CocE/NonD family hydrolase [Bacteroidia bacterium]|nr:CocE/NonD family hydrolase [Bacteroidia bacterium]